MVSEVEEMVIAQYHECCDDFREYGRLIWQAASLGVTVATGVVIGSYAYLNSSWIRAGILFSAFWYALGVAFISAKYRHYSEIRADTATKIEDALKVKRIQRRTATENGGRYWVEKKANLLQPKGTHWIFISAMFGVAGIVFVIFLADVVVLLCRLPV